MMGTQHSYSVDTLRQLAAAGSGFYQDLLRDFQRTGGLTAKQIETLRERPIYGAVEQPAKVSPLEKAFGHARSKGLQPRINLGGFQFLFADPAKASPMNKDAIFVTDPNYRGRYFGKVIRGDFLPVGDCPKSVITDVTSVVNDPHAAAVQYGLATGVCAICSRKLTNEKSVQLGIGPVCRSNMGW